MKKILVMIATVIFCLSVFSVVSFASAENTSSQNAITVKNEEISDNLPDKKAERWYKFENKTKGDVVVFFKNTDNIDNIWRLQLFDSTAQKELGFNNCDGTAYNKTYEALDAGTYYLKITIGSTYDHDSFDDLNYTIRIRTISDVNIVPNENGAFVVTEDGQEMFVLDGRVYSKKGNGVTIAALQYDYNGDSYIILVGEREEDLEFYESSSDFTKTIVRKTFEYENGERYHYLTFRLYSRQLMTDLYVCNNGERTKYSEDNAYELMNLYNGKDANAEKESLWRELQKDYGPLVMLGIGIGIFIAIAVIVVIVKSINDMIYRRRNPQHTGTYSLSVSDDYVSTTTVEEMVDMDIAKNVINNIGGTDGI